MSSPVQLLWGKKNEINPSNPKQRPNPKAMRNILWFLGTRHQQQVLRHCMQRTGPTGKYALHRKGEQQVANKAKEPVLERAFQEHTAPQHWTLREGKFPKSHHADLCYHSWCDSD